jgi:hypothetical protein
MSKSCSKRHILTAASCDDTTQERPIADNNTRQNILKYIGRPVNFKYFTLRTLDSESVVLLLAGAVFSIVVCRPRTPLLPVSKYSSYLSLRDRDYVLEKVLLIRNG